MATKTNPAKKPAKKPCEHGYTSEVGWVNWVDAWGADPRYGRCLKCGRRLLLDPRRRRARKAQPEMWKWNRTRRYITPGPAMWSERELAAATDGRRTPWRVIP